jgi:glycosyltransferase involved in cell wall biosynthesis
LTRVAVIGPVYPFRAGIAHCTTRLAEELARRHDVTLISFKRQYPRSLYPGESDRDPTLNDRTPGNAEFILDILNPISWIQTARRLREVDVVIFVWWIWVWAIPYLIIQALLPRKVGKILQCHNVNDKEPAPWKSALTNFVLGNADHVIVHAASEEREAGKRTTSKIIRSFLPVHEVGGPIPSRVEARQRLGIASERVALMFGHVRPFKGVDIALEAWKDLQHEVLLLVAGEIWWNESERYRTAALKFGNRVRFDSRFIPDAEIADYFAAADVVLAPYRAEAQSGVILTAFHFGRPVIATRVGGIPEIVGDGFNGLLVAPENPRALAGAINAFFSSSTRQKMEEAAAMTALKLSWPEYVNRLTPVLEGMSS